MFTEVAETLISKSNKNNGEADEGETCQWLSEGISEKVRLELKFGKQSTRKKTREGCSR